jgi:hypothetical protein
VSADTIESRALSAPAATTTTRPTCALGRRRSSLRSQQSTVAAGGERENLHVLVSYAFFKGPKSLEVLRPDWNVLLDSGAFTNFTTGKDVVTLDGYTQFLQEHGSKFWHYIALDVIGDKARSEANLRTMRAAGLRPAPVFQRGGATAQDLQAMLRQNELVCIGGISQNLGAKAEQEYLRSVMEVVRTVPDAKVHLLGVGSREASLYNPFSADSSTWSSATRFGITKLWHRGRFVYMAKWSGARGKDQYIDPDVNKNRVLQSYGLTWQQLGDKRAWMGGGAAEIAGIRSWIRYARDLRRKGCRYILAMSSGSLPSFTKAWELEKHNWGW